MTGVVLSLALLCASRIVITEVMANPAGKSGSHMPEDRNEFVEIYNSSDNAIDLLDWTVSDGDGADHLTAWTDSSILNNCPALRIGSTWLNPGRYAVVLDSEYTDPSPLGGFVQPYRFGDSALILTTGNTTLGNGLAATDPVIAGRLVGLRTPRHEHVRHAVEPDRLDSLRRRATACRGNGSTFADRTRSATGWPARTAARPAPPTRAFVRGPGGRPASRCATRRPARPAPASAVSSRSPTSGFPETASLAALPSFLDRNSNGREDAGDDIFYARRLAACGTAPTRRLRSDSPARRSAPTSGPG